MVAFLDAAPDPPAMALALDERWKATPRPPRTAGLCLHCGATHYRGAATLCSKCIAPTAAEQRRADLRREGRCLNCEQPNDRLPRTLCTAYGAAASARTRAWQARRKAAAQRDGASGR